MHLSDELCTLTASDYTNPPVNITYTTKYYLLIGCTDSALRAAVCTPVRVCQSFVGSTLIESKLVSIYTS